MGMYGHIKNTFEKQYKEGSPEYKKRVSAWKNEASVVPLKKPTNLSRARTLGYKAKQGYKVVRVRIGRGRRKRPSPSGGRKPPKNIRFLAPGISLRRQAEQRAARKHRNMEVLNSYWAGEDGQRKYFEVILVDADKHPHMLRKSRAYKGLTSASKKGRGLRKK